MKKSQFSLLFLSLITFATFAQKVDKYEVEFNYIQLPNNPLPKDIVNYSSDVILSYEEEILREKQKAQDEFDRAMAEYPAQVEEAKLRHDEQMKHYEEEMATYNAKSTGAKIIEKQLLNEDSKPRRPSDFYPPSKPYLREVRHQKLANKSLIASSYLKLEGFKSSEENALKITAILHGFESTEPELKTRQTTVYNSSTKSSTPVNYYHYETSYKHPIQLKITMPNGDVLIDETFEEFNSYTLDNTPESKGSMPGMSKDAHLAKLQDKIIEQNMKIINNYINDTYGFRTMSRKTTIYRIESGKMNYDDYQQAFELALPGFNMLASNKTGAMEKLNAAITIWENALTESMPQDKKSRINGDITLLTMFNLIETLTWTNAYDKAEEYMNKMVALDPSKKELKMIEEYRDLVKAEKQRWAVNNQ